MILNGGLGFSPPFFIEGPNTLLSFSIVQSYVLFWALVQYCDFLDLNNCLKYLKPFQTSKQLPKNSILRVLIDREELSIDQKLFSINRIGIEQRSTHLVTPRLFFLSFRSIEQKFQPIENPGT